MKPPRSAAFAMPPLNTAGFVIRQAALQMPLNAGQLKIKN